MHTFGLDRRDGRNMLIVAVIMTALVAITADGSLVVRIVAGTIMGGITAVVFVISTLLINRFKPDHW